MTCIVGIEHKDGVTIGGDSAGVSGWSLTQRADEKVFTRDGYIFGFTSSFRMGQLLRYAGDLPTPPKRDLDRFMATKFVDAIRATLKAGGYTSTVNGREESGTFLVGTRGRLYRIDGDHQIGRPLTRYDAIGCGDDIALGSLHTTAALKITDPRRRARLALQASVDLSAGVAAPLKIRTLPAV